MFPYPMITEYELAVFTREYVNLFGMPEVLYVERSQMTAYK